MVHPTDFFNRRKRTATFTRSITKTSIKKYITSSAALQNDSEIEKKAAQFEKI
jgi:hypothetical protein